jgi:hypothetical protein
MAKQGVDSPPKLAVPRISLDWCLLHNAMAPYGFSGIHFSCRLVLCASRSGPTLEAEAQVVRAEALDDLGTAFVFSFDWGAIVGTLNTVRANPISNRALFLQGTEHV